jgi:hypothetical protein
MPSRKNLTHHAQLHYTSKQWLMLWFRGVVASGRGGSLGIEVSQQKKRRAQMGLPGKVL